MLPPQPSPLCLSFSLLQSLYPESSLPLRAQCQLQFFFSRFLSRNRSLYRFTFQFMHPALFSLVVLVSLCPFPLAFLPWHSCIERRFLAPLDPVAAALTLATLVVSIPSHLSPLFFLFAFAPSNRQEQLSSSSPLRILPFLLFFFLCSLLLFSL